MLSIAQRLNRLLRHSHWCVLFAVALSLTFSGVCTLLMGIPIPRVHDEFAYLLGADTYASGRLSNPTHELWEHFESFHVISQPSYMPKYPPAQSALLAVGQCLGHPYIGVCLSSALAAGALTWMMIVWVPWRYRWLCVAVAGLHPILHIKWGHSYLGGAMGVLAASLLVGALFRSLHRLSFRNSILAALGIGLLANSRPFEGAVLTLCVSIALLIRITQRKQWKHAIAKVVVPAGAVLILVAAAMMANNSRVTGHPLRLAYQVYEQQYGRVPLFLWQSAKTDQPTYRHQVLKDFYQNDTIEAEQKYATLTSILVEKGWSLIDTVHFIMDGGVYLLLAALPLAWVSFRIRLTTILLVPTLLAAAVTPWTFSHYLAPAVPLLLMLFVLILVWGLKLLHRRQQSAVSGVVVVAIVAVIWIFQSWTVYQMDQGQNQIAWAKRRQQIQQDLMDQPGLDLVLVSYSAKHNTHTEWVYNRADIDRAEVVWARSMSEEADRRLIEYFKDRKLHRLHIEE